MGTLKQIEANRLNALNSTGPKTSQGKERSRCNAIRHGLSAETAIVGLEEAHDYEAFEATVIADYDAQSAVERELVLRLASVLWRLRRATGIETSLFQTTIKQSGQSEALTRAGVDLSLSRLFLDQSSKGPHTDGSRKESISQTFVRLTDMPTCPMSRLNRYEHLLWRQARQIVMTLKSLQSSWRGQRHKRPQFMSGHHRTTYFR